MLKLEIDASGEMLVRFVLDLLMTLTLAVESWCMWANSGGGGGGGGKGLWLFLAMRLGVDCCLGGDICCLGLLFEEKTMGGRRSSSANSVSVVLRLDSARDWLFAGRCLWK